MIAGALNGRDLESLFHPTGEFAARFMIIAMMLTPLRMMFPSARPIRWLMARRRYLGVAAFGYAALHTFYYVVDLGSFSVGGTPGPHVLPPFTSRPPMTTSQTSSHLRLPMTVFACGPAGRSLRRRRCSAPNHSTGR